MQMIKEGTSLVIAGFWNRYIFNENWIRNFIFPGKDKIIAEYPLNIEASPRFSNNLLRVAIIGNKLQILSIDNTIESFSQMDDIANKIADFLPHTPVQSFGINFRFEDEDKSKYFINLCKNPFEGEPILEQFTYTYKTKIDDKNININVIIPKFEENIIVISFNYHFDIPDLNTLKGIIASHQVLELCNDAEKIIADYFLKKE
jgi:hypothetical protein